MPRWTQPLKSVWPDGRKAVYEGSASVLQIFLFFVPELDFHVLQQIHAGINFSCESNYSEIKIKLVMHNLN